MKRIFVIFAAVTGWAKFFAYALSVLFSLTALSAVVWFWYDDREVNLRNDVLAQQQVVELTGDLAEKKKLIELRREYVKLRESKLGKLFLGEK